MDKSFKEIECPTTILSIDEDGDEYKDAMQLGTLVMVFEDGTNSQYGLKAVDLKDKQVIWKAFFNNQIPRGYGVVCGDNRIIFRRFGSEQ